MQIYSGGIELSPKSIEGDVAEISFGNSCGTLALPAVVEDVGFVWQEDVLVVTAGSLSLASLYCVSWCQAHILDVTETRNQRWEA